MILSESQTTSVGGDMIDEYELERIRKESVVS